MYPGSCPGVWTCAHPTQKALKSSPTVSILKSLTLTGPLIWRAFIGQPYLKTKKSAVRSLDHKNVANSGPIVNTGQG